MDIEDILEQCTTATRNGVSDVLISVSNLEVYLCKHESHERKNNIEMLDYYTTIVKTIFNLYGCLSGYGDIMSFSERELQEHLDNCLGLCGLYSTFLEALRCLKDISSCASKSPQLHSLLVSLRIVRRIMSFPDESDVNDNRGSQSDKDIIYQKNVNETISNACSGGDWDAHDDRSLEQWRASCNRGFQSMKYFCLENLIHEYIDHEKITCKMFTSNSIQDDLKMEHNSNIVLNMIDDLVKLLLLLPVKIATACHAAKIHLPHWAMKEKYSSRLIETALFHALGHFSTAVTPTQIHPLPVNQFFFTLVHTMVRHGGSQDVALGFYRLWSRNNRQTIKYTKILTDVMRSLAMPTDCGCLIQAIIRLSVSRVELLPVYNYTQGQDLELTIQECIPFIKDSCLGILQESKSIRDEFIRIMVLSPSPSCDIIEQRVLLRCTIYLIRSCIGPVDTNPNISSHSHADKCAILTESLEKVVYVWCEPKFAQKTDETRQMIITEFILLALNHMQQQGLNEDREQRIIEMLMSGISSRLATSSFSARKDGMRVGEKIATLLGHELKFDELNDERVIEEHMRSTVLGVQRPVHDISSTVSNHAKNRVQRIKQVDPDEEILSDSDQRNSGTDRNEVDKYIDDDSDWGEDGIIPYDLDDDEQDLHEVTKPKYLRDCLDMLRSTGDDYSSLCTFETALEHLPLLIRANPSDLKIFVEPLTKELLCMQNRFDLDSFGDRRFDGLCALIVREPILVTRYLCDAVFEDDVVMDMRLDILNALSYSSSELSGAIELRSQRHSYAIDVCSCKISGKRSLVPRLEDFSTNDGSTRRWGRGKRRNESRTVLNTFGPIAAYVFYPLLHGFMESRGKENIWNGVNGSLFLSQLLLCLSTILTNTFNHPSANIMAPDLFELSWALHSADDSSVRKSVLVAMLVCCEYLPESKIISIRHNQPSFRGFLEMTKMADVDGDCRNLSKALFFNFFGVYSIA